jgi:hypothetical protein
LFNHNPLKIVAMAESSCASVASLQDHVSSDDGELERPSFIEVARVTTGEMPSVAPTTLGNPDAGIDRPPASFGSLTREILVIAVCTWAPGGGVFPNGVCRLTDRPRVLGLYWWD